MTVAPVPHRIYDADWAETDTPSGKLNYHVVTEETRGRVAVPGGYQDAQEGDILVPVTPGGDTFNLYSPGAFDFLPGNAAEKTNVTASNSNAIDLSGAADYDPTERSATHVRRFVSALVSEGRHEEAQRIVNDERADKDRKTAVPQSYADWEAEQSEE